MALQKSFLDAFMKGQDDRGWTVEGKVPAVDLVLRKGDPGFNNAAAEKAAFPRRFESAWPIPGTEYRKLHLRSGGDLQLSPEVLEHVVSYEAPG